MEIEIFWKGWVLKFVCSLGFQNEFKRDSFTEENGLQWMLCWFLFDVMLFRYKVQLLWEVNLMNVFDLAFCSAMFVIYICIVSWEKNSEALGLRNVGSL